jgi:hypothetical protein
VHAVALTLACAVVIGSVTAQQSVPTPTQVRERSLMRRIERMALPSMPFRIGHTRVGVDGCLTVVLADIDQDGDLDLFTEPVANVPARQLRNDGNGRFTELTRTLMPTGIPSGFLEVSVVDLDGDGDLDWVGGIGTLGNLWPIRVLINHGSGQMVEETFHRVPQASNSFPFAHSPGLGVGDFDGDGDLDLVCSASRDGNYPRAFGLLRNDGTGHFTYDSTAIPETNQYFGEEYGKMNVADLDGDGDLDFLCGGFLPGGSVFINDGLGNFANETTARMGATAPNFLFIITELGDVDGDGDQDLAAAVMTTGRFERPRLLLNDGLGYFTDVTDTHMPQRGHGGSAMHFADFDDDGDLDLLSVKTPNIYIGYVGEHHVFLNDGTGHFTFDEHATIYGSYSNGFAHRVAIADLDGDGDLDAIEATSSAGPQPSRTIPVYFNTLRHVWAEGSPERGRPWRVTVAGEAGSQGLLLLSFAETRIPLPPLGRLGLDPTQLVIWQPGFTLLPNADTEVVVPIPNIPQLGQSSLYVQALLQEPTRGLRLTNTWVEEQIR